MRLYLSSYRLGNHATELVKLLRGSHRAAVITNAGDATKGKDRAAWLEREIASLRELGLEPYELDLRSYFGRTEALAETLRDTNMLWVLGGNAFVLRRAFRASGLDELLPDLLATDRLIYAGYSAGIDQLIPHLHGVELVDDPHDVPEGYDPAIVWEALGILPYAVAPHYQSDHPESAAIDKSVEYLIDHHVPFIALHDGQVIIRDGEREWVAS